MLGSLNKLREQHETAVITWYTANLLTQLINLDTSATKK